MSRLLKVYDFALGAMLGAATTLLIQGHHDAALGTALIALGLRVLVGSIEVRA